MVQHPPHDSVQVLLPLDITIKHQDVIGLSPGDRREVCLGEQDLDGEDGGAGKGG